MFKKRLLSRSRDTVTLPDERYRAVEQTRRFLIDLCNPQHTPRVPKLIRDTARSMLRHYPTTFDMMATAEAAPDIFAERMEDLHRFVMSGSREVGFRSAEVNEAAELKSLQGYKHK
jgi:hypothetical protein